MRLGSKHFVCHIAALAASALAAAPALGQGRDGSAPDVRGPALPGSVLGGLALGDSFGGVTDRAFVAAPANYRYVVSREPGSFIDCGSGAEARATDASGRDEAHLVCGVTLTETVVVPAASASARLTIHF
ncbi:MAG: hypothetical protein ACFB00_01620 [Parvularculaceae bacterium]